MDRAYADTVRLLLTIAPDVFRSEGFALKGGTAINMFVRDMPRLSVDMDVVYTRWEPSREEALATISAELTAIRHRLVRMGLSVNTVGSRDTGDRTLLVSGGSTLVKIEVNVVFRGTVLPVQRRPLVQRAADLFAAELELPILAVEELYGSKLVAAMDRQHPRDLFDMRELYKADGLTDNAIACFVIYLAGHHRPMHEVLCCRRKDISHEFNTTFVGLTTEPVALAALLETRERLCHEIRDRLSADQRAFLIGLARAEPDWSLLQCPHAAQLPALQWKLLNLEKLKKSRPSKLKEQAEELERALE